MPRLYHLHTFLNRYTPVFTCLYKLKLSSRLHLVHNLPFTTHGYSPNLFTYEHFNNVWHSHPPPKLGGESYLLRSSPLPLISKPLLQPHYSTSLSPYIWAFKDLQPCYVISCLYSHITWQSMSGMKAAPLGNTVSPLGMTTRGNKISLNNKMA
jgi:hypothetical protein